MTRTMVKARSRDEILEISTPLFAKSGYAGVSMRDLALAVGVTPAALYYHFADKDELYVGVIDHACQDVTSTLKSALDDAGSPRQRLAAACTELARMLAGNENLWRLMQWVLMDEDEQRLSRLGTTVFHGIFVLFHDLAAQLGEAYDSHQLAVSIISLLIFPFQSAKACRFLPGFKPENQTPEALSTHVLDLLTRGLSDSAPPAHPAG